MSLGQSEISWHTAYIIIIIFFFITILERTSLRNEAVAAPNL